MRSWLKNILAGLVGIFTGGLCLALIDAMAHQFVSGEAKFVIAAMALSVAAFAGGAIAIFISRKAYLAWVVAGVLLALSLINVFSFPHPVWFVPLAIASLGLGAIAAKRLMRSRARA